MKDMLNLVHPVPAIAPVSVADNTAQVGIITDRQGFNSLTYLVALGAISDADATFAVKLEHGSQANLSDAVLVDANDLLGTTALAAFTFAEDNKTRKIGYRGNLRYVRLTITPVNNASAALLSSIALLGHPAKIPTVNPPG